MTMLGCIADDFTGATDIGSVLASVGRDVVVVFDTARVTRTDLRRADAVIVALKSRTAPIAEAVADSVAAAQWLATQGAERFYFKYCSTFDSTDTGNIGPVIDALLDELQLSTALAAPSYPQNGRTVYQGTLFVHHQRLDESPMRHHPLTPMHDANVARLLAPQTSTEITNLYLDDVRAADVAASLDEHGRRIVVADAVSDDDLIVLARTAGEHVLLTGSAGLALGLGLDTGAERTPLDAPTGERLILSGSASQATRGQVQHAASAQIESQKLDLTRLASDDDAEQYAVELFAWVSARWDARPGEAVLLFATDDIADIAPDPETARRIEIVLGAVARLAAADRLGALIVAGGETSGRVVQDLGVASLRIGPSIAQGVVWAEARTEHGPVAVALKSGNFGAEDMFTSAWGVLA